MKKYFIGRKKTLYVLCSLLLVVIIFGCVYIDSVSVMQVQKDGSLAPQINAGKVATFTVDGHINCAEDHHNVAFVVAVLAPKSWDIRHNMTMTYQTTVLSSFDQVYTMSPIPESNLPKNAGGLTWSNALMQKYGVGTNVLNDMEWVAFWTDKLWDINNGEKPNYRITIKCKVGMQNLKVHLGFFVNHTDDGISTSTDHQKVVFSPDDFEVKNGTGSLIDFCNNHYQKTEPLAALQNDYVTFSFQGGAYTNSLVNSDAIYLEATAYTDKNSYTVNEKSLKTLMTKQGTYGKTFSITMSPAIYFGIPDDETIDRIDYSFTNKDGTVSITQSDDDAAISGTTAPINKQPFSFKLLCN